MICRFCHEEKEVHISCRRWNKDKTKQYIYYACKGCDTERIKKYRATYKGKEAVRRAVLKYETKNPGRVAAWKAVKSMPPRPCFMCGDKNVHAHHPDPEDKFYVVFLCPKHHKNVHLKAGHLEA